MMKNRKLTFFAFAAACFIIAAFVGMGVVGALTITGILSAVAAVFIAISEIIDNGE